MKGLKIGNATVREKPRSVAETIGMNPGRIWYPIGDTFKGYEVSNDYYVRSTKLFYSEGGCLIRPRKNKKGISGYDLVDSEGRKKHLTIDDIVRLASSNPFKRTNSTTDIQSASRNKRAFQKKDKLVNDTMMRLITPRFTVVPDSNPTPIVTTTVKREQVICPIYDMDRPTEVYYGRTEKERQR